MCGYVGMLVCGCVWVCWCVKIWMCEGMGVGVYGYEGGCLGVLVYRCVDV